jgi:tetratricopeptide (TPR) repeat protein
VLAHPEADDRQEAKVMSPDFGGRLRELRRVAGISQVELAGDQLSPSYISLLEAGKRHPSDEVIQLLAERLRCSVEDLANPVTREQAERIQLEIAYAKLAMANGEAEDARRRLEAVLPSVPTDKEAGDDVRFLLAEAYWRAGEHRAAIESLLPVYEHCVARASHLPLTTVALRLTRCYLEAGDLQAAIRHGESALQVMAEQGLEHTDEYLRAAATLVAAYYEAGDLAHATVWVSGMIERAEQRGSTPGQAALYWNAAVVAEAQGRLSDAVHLSQRALALMSEQNSSRDLGVLYTTCAYFLLEVDPGRAGRAVGLLERALPLLKDFASAADLGAWEATRALAALAQDEPVAAEDFARQAVVTLAETPQPEAAQARLSLGDALAVQGRHDEAAASYLAASAVLEQCPPVRKVAVIWREVADRLAGSGQEEAALVAYRRALDSVGVRATPKPGGVASPGHPTTDAVSHVPPRQSGTGSGLTLTSGSFTASRERTSSRSGTGLANTNP